MWVVKRQRGCSLHPDLSNVVVLEGVGLRFPCSRVVETVRRPNYYGDFRSRRGKIQASWEGVTLLNAAAHHRGSIAMVVELTHASYKRLASESNGTVMTPGRSDAFPYRFQEVAVATTTSTYTCIISSQPRPMAAQLEDIDYFFFLEIHNQSQVHHVSQTLSTRVGRTSYRICRLHSHSSATTHPFLSPRSPCSLAKRTLRPSSSKKKKFHKTNLPLRGMRNTQKRL